MNEEQRAVKKALEEAFLILCPVQFSIQRIDDDKSMNAYSSLLSALNDFEKRLGDSNE